MTESGGSRKRQRFISIALILFFAVIIGGVILLRKVGTGGSENDLTAGGERGHQEKPGRGADPDPDSRKSGRTSAAKGKTPSIGEPQDLAPVGPETGASTTGERTPSSAFSLENKSTTLTRVGRITGRVRIKGQAPPPRVLDVSSSANCALKSSAAARKGARIGGERLGQPLITSNLIVPGCLFFWGCRWSPAASMQTVELSSLLLGFL